MNDLDQYSNNPDLTAAAGAVDTANATASQYQTAAANLPSQLTSAINEKLDYNKDLITTKNQSMVDYFNAPSAARLEYQDIFNPFQREALVQTATNNSYLTYKNNQDILNARTGSIQDIISKATGAFNSQVKSAENAAASAKDKLAYLLQMAGLKSDVAYKKAQLAIDKYKADKTGSGDSTLDMLKWLATQFKASPGQEDKANNAQVGLDSISRIKQIMASDPSALSDSKNPLKAFGLLNPNARELKKELSNVTDLLTRARTGAALNQEEEKFYNSFIANPLEAVLGWNNGTEAALGVMQSIFNKAVNQVKNPYMDIIEKAYGMGGTSDNSDPMGLGI
jgi:hypothetical protein